jgi:hypothetical protein
VESLRQKAQEAGVETIPERTPATELVQTMLSEPWLYRLSSAVMHGHLWTMRLIYEEVPLPPDHASPGTAAIAKRPKADSLGYVLVASAEALARPFWNQAAYMGWDSAGLGRILDDGFDEMGLTDRRRFWRRAV